MLNGFRIIELATHIAAPAAGGLFADWGADVIKIEPPAGDPMRRLRPDAPGGCSPVFETNNRGKRSLSLDISHADGRDIVLRLIDSADVFLTNLRPKSLRRAGLDPTALRARNPRLVYASVTGYGLTGPEANSPAFDAAAFWSRSGFANLMTPPGGEPFSIRLGAGDHICALSAALGVVTALLARSKTGEGRLVETSLLRSGVYVQGADFSNHIRLGAATPMAARDAPNNAFINYYRTHDGRWLFVMSRSSRPDDWRAIAWAADLPDLAADDTLANPTVRATRTQELTRRLDQGFAQVTFEAAVARLSQDGVVWSTVPTPGEVLADPQTQAAGCFVPIDEDGGAFLSPAPPVRFNSSDIAPARPPRLGEHSNRILEELGLSPAAVRSLRDQELVSG